MNENYKYFFRLKNLYENFFKEKLKEHEFIDIKLDLLYRAIKNTKKVFEETGSFAFCAECAKSGEKCCSAGVELKLSPAEFFINLLLAEKMNYNFSFNLERSLDCLFLGESGCILILVPIFCRNFFCEKLSKFLGHKNLIKIQQTMEEEAILSFELADYINKKYLIPYSHLIK